MKAAVICAAMMSLFALSPVTGQTIVAAPPHTSNVDGFVVTEGDIADRPYTELGSVSAKAGKLTWVSRNPDWTDVDRKLRDKGHQMGADAVIRVRYGSTGVSAMSWGGVKAEGMAIRFNQLPVTGQSQAAVPSPSH